MSSNLSKPDDTPARLPVYLRRGDTYPPIEWAFGPEDAPEDLTGLSFYLTVAWQAADGRPAGSFTVRTTDGGLIVDPLKGIIRWAYTLAQGNLLPKGDLARYVLSQFEGTDSETWVYGHVNVEAWLPA